MSIQDKFDAVLSLINEHNAAVGGVNRTGYIDAERFLALIKGSGGTSEDRLRSMSYEDILVCIPQPSLVDCAIRPIALAKDIAKIFRGKEDSTEPVLKSCVSEKKAGKMPLRVLVEAYDPDDPDNAVGKRLKAVSRGEPFVVFKDNNSSVDIETTLKLLLEVKSGYPGRTDIEVNEEIKPVYRVGDRVDIFVDENPLYPKRPLRPDGTCDQTGRSWGGAPLEVRQFVRVAIDEKDLSVNIETAHNILDIVMGETPLKKLRQRYRAASLKFDELKRLGNLPKLLVSLFLKKGEPQRPFAKGTVPDWGHVVQQIEKAQDYWVWRQGVGYDYLYSPSYSQTFQIWKSTTR